MCVLWGSRPMRLEGGMVMDGAAWSTVGSINVSHRARPWTQGVKPSSTTDYVLRAGAIMSLGLGSPRRRVFRIRFRYGRWLASMSVSSGCAQGCFWRRFSNVLPVSANLHAICDGRWLHLSSINVDPKMIISASTCNGRWPRFCLCNGLLPWPESCSFF